MKPTTLVRMAPISPSVTGSSSVPLTESHNLQVLYHSVSERPFWWWAGMSSVARRKRWLSTTRPLSTVAIPTADEKTPSWAVHEPYKAGKSSHADREPEEKHDGHSHEGLVDVVVLREQDRRCAVHGGVVAALHGGCDLKLHGRKGWLCMAGWTTPTAVIRSPYYITTSTTARKATSVVAAT